MIRNSLLAITFWLLAIGLAAQEKDRKHVVCTAEESAKRIDAAIRERIRKSEGELATKKVEKSGQFFRGEKLS